MPACSSNCVSIERRNFIGLVMSGEANHTLRRWRGCVLQKPKAMKCSPFGKFAEYLTQTQKQELLPFRIDGTLVAIVFRERKGGEELLNRRAGRNEFSH